MYNRVESSRADAIVDTANIRFRNTIHRRDHGFKSTFIAVHCTAMACSCFVKVIRTTHRSIAIFYDRKMQQAIRLAVSTAPKTDHANPRTSRSTSSNTFNSPNPSSSFTIYQPIDINGEQKNARPHTPKSRSLHFLFCRRLSVNRCLLCSLSQRRGRFLPFLLLQYIPHPSALLTDVVWESVTGNERRTLFWSAGQIPEENETFATGTGETRKNMTYQLIISFFFSLSLF